MKSSVKLLLYIWIITFMPGCNNDIFIDGPEMPDYSYAQVAGDGGTVSFEISTTGLKLINFDLFSENKKYCKYFNRNGEEISPYSPASELGSIVFENHHVKYVLEKKGNRLTFTSLENSSSENHLSIRLEYDYTVKFIEIEIERGQPLEMICVEYDNMKINDRAKKDVQTYKFTNYGPINQTLNWYPYSHNQASVIVEPDEDWIRGDFVIIPLPAYSDGKWKLEETGSIRLGTKMSFYRSDYMNPVPIELPPYANIVLISNVIYSMCQVEGSMTFRNPVSGRIHQTGFMCEALYPTDYEIRIDYED